MGELDFIKWIREHSKTVKPVLVGPGDDSAVISVDDNKSFVVTTDTLLDGTHFEKENCSPELIGRKAITSSVSDIAAMGCKPEFTLISLIFPEKTDRKYCETIFTGIKESADRYKIQIIGGDIVSGKSALAINVTVIGSAYGYKPVLRSNAKVNDVIMVTGKLGGSILRKHLQFEPRISAGIILNRKYNIHSMIDISDGLLVDLSHILDESGVGAVINESQIPISNDAEELSLKSKKSPLIHALTDGEDYELLFTASISVADKILISREFDVSFTVIGCIKKSKGLFLEGFNGKVKIDKPKGYEHLANE